MAKLRAANIDVSKVPLVGSDGDPRREDIVRAAIERLGGSGEITYVGDGIWDALAAKNLGIRFIGVDLIVSDAQAVLQPRRPTRAYSTENTKCVLKQTGIGCGR